MSRHESSTALVICSLSILLLAGCAGSVTMTASPGANPGIALGPPYTGGLLTDTSTITATSKNGYDGNVTLTASCCHDAIRDRFVNFAGTGQATVVLQSKTLAVPKGGSASTTLNLSVPKSAGSLVPGPQMPYGKWLVNVAAQVTNVAGTFDTQVGFRLLPGFEPQAACAASAETLPLKSVLETQIDATELEPRKTSLVVAVFRKTGPDTWRWTIEDDASVHPAESRIILVNQTAGDKQITTAGCSSVSRTASAKTNQNDQISLLQGFDRTIVFRKRVCVGILCSSTQWEDVAVFAEPAFWSVFGGKKMTFTWLKE